MLVKLGVDISRLNREIRRALNVIEKVYLRFDGCEAIITSTYDGNHSPASLHYANDAVDLRSSTDSDIIIELKSRLGKNYDIIQESDHLHIEYDPKEKW